MSNAKTGFWSALGAIAGGAAGAAAGRYAAMARPSVRYTEAPRRRTRGQAIEDAMVVGGATGAVVGAFLAGTIAGDETPPTPQLPPR
jgi:hypothetical protein